MLSTMCITNHRLPRQNDAYYIQAAYGTLACRSPEGGCGVAHSTIIMIAQVVTAYIMRS